VVIQPSDFLLLETIAPQLVSVTLGGEFEAHIELAPPTPIHMRRVAKRVLVFAIEICVLLFGLVATVGFAVYFGSFLVFVVGTVLTEFTWSAIRAKIVNGKFSTKRRVGFWSVQNSICVPTGQNGHALFDEG